jgi:hypothetical protein
MILTILMAVALNAGTAVTDGSKMSAVTNVSGSAGGPVCARMMPDAFAHQLLIMKLRFATRELGAVYCSTLEPMNR